jgi:tetratricopeptide (TPR) repeat protein
MVEVTAQPGGLQHVVFLERAVHDASAMPGGFGKAAFLVLRLVDLVSVGYRPSVRNELFGYQAAATGRYCSEHLEPDPSSDLLLDLVRVATYAHRREDPGLLAPAMIALAHGLEDMACYEEALDVLRTLERVARLQLRPADAVTAALRTARLERQMGRFDLAEVAYARAADMATASHSTEALLRSRLGRANVLRLRGNLAEAQHSTEAALIDARNAGERDMEAEAEHHLGIVLGTRGELHEAVPHFWRAFQLHSDGALATYALSDLGVALSRLGAVSDAERALHHVAARNAGRGNVQNAMIELMNCASFRRDRVGFERCRAFCAKEQAQMSPNILADYLLKLGIGLARFGQFDRAETELTHALQVAQAHQLHEFEFRIERIKGGLGDCVGLDIAEHDAETEAPAPRAELGAVSTALTSLTGFTTP